MFDTAAIATISVKVKQFVEMVYVFVTEVYSNAMSNV
jgi:hypothetical protein